MIELHEFELEDIEQLKSWVVDERFLLMFAEHKYKMNTLDLKNIFTVFSLQKMGKVISMNCIKCKSKMKKGKIFTKGSARGFIVFGLSLKHLFFKSDNEKEKKIKILNDEDEAVTYYCENCKIIISMLDEVSRQDTNLI